MENNGKHQSPRNFGYTSSKPKSSPKKVGSGWYKDKNGKLVPSPKVDKYFNGTKSIVVPDVESYDAGSSALSGAAQGASVGSALGPYGAAIGAVAGAGRGMMQGKANYKNSVEANENAKELNAQYKMQGIGDTEIDPMTQSFQAKNGYHNSYEKGTKTIEIEKGEVVTDEDYNIKGVGKTPHSQGGDDVVVEEGDTVFPTQKATDYKSLMTKIRDYKNGVKSAKTELDAEKNKLPSDSKKGKYPTGADEIIVDTPYGGGGDYSTPQYSFNDPAPAVNNMTANEVADIPVYNETDKMDDWSPSKQRRGFNGDFDASNLNSAMKYANTAYNYNKSKEDVQGYEAEKPGYDKYKYQDTSAPQRRAALDAYKMDQNNLDKTGGSRGQMQSYQGLAAQRYVRNTGDINTQEGQRKLGVYNQNIGLENQARQMEYQDKLGARKYRQMGQGVQESYRGEAAKGLAEQAYMNEQMKYMKSRNKKQYEMDKLRLENMGTDDYQIGSEGKTSYRYNR